MTSAPTCSGGAPCPEPDGGRAIWSGGLAQRHKKRACIASREANLHDEAREVSQKPRMLRFSGERQQRRMPHPTLSRPQGPPSSRRLVCRRWSTPIPSWICTKFYGIKFVCAFLGVIGMRDGFLVRDCRFLGVRGGWLDLLLTPWQQLIGRYMFK